jgi:glucokinase
MYYVGIDLGGTNIAAGVVDENGVLLNKDSVPTKRERQYQEIIKDMAQLAIKVIKDKGLDIKDIKSIGIGSPGTRMQKKVYLFTAAI